MKLKAAVMKYVEESLVLCGLALCLVTGQVQKHAGGRMVRPIHQKTEWNREEEKLLHLSKLHAFTEPSHPSVGLPANAWSITKLLDAAQQKEGNGDQRRRSTTASRRN
jgi:hypothetical protein